MALVVTIAKLRFKVIVQTISTLYGVIQNDKNIK